MPLIKCPECGREVSDKALVCIHCGYPLSDMNNNNTNEESVEILLTHIGNDKLKVIKEIRCIFNMSLTDAVNIVDNHSVMKTNITKLEADNIKNKIESVGGGVTIRKCIDHSIIYNTNDYRNSLSVPYCPKCGSTSITTSARGVDGFWGFLGASSTVNRCANCGHAWYPETGKSI